MGARPDGSHEGLRNVLLFSNRPTKCGYLLFPLQIARFGHGSAKLARQAQSKEKTLAKMVAGGLTEKVEKDKTVSFHFPSCGPIPPPVIMVQNVRYQCQNKLIMPIK